MDQSAGCKWRVANCQYNSGADFGVLFGSLTREKSRYAEEFGEERDGEVEFKFLSPLDKGGWGDFVAKFLQQ